MMKNFFIMFIFVILMMMKYKFKFLNFLMILEMLMLMLMMLLLLKLNNLVFNEFNMFLVVFVCEACLGLFLLILKISFFLKDLIGNNSLILI